LTAFNKAAISESGSGVDTTTPVPTSRSAAVMVSTKDAVGVLAPRSVTENPRHVGKLVDHADAVAGYRARLVSARTLSER
jgi:hypothetical protein